MPITLAILTVLFAIQRFGTGAVGRLFGPVMALWFAVLAVARPGPRSSSDPAILQGALARRYGDRRSSPTTPAIAFIALGSVVLAVTGAEALYADMGHFGRAPIRRAWFVLVFPALTLNYLGQGVADPRVARGDRQPVLPARARTGRASRWSCSRRSRR